MRRPTRAFEALLGLAAVAVVDGDLSHAARLRGAAVAHGYGQQQDESREA
jgi:hypothetical protein